MSLSDPIGDMLARIKNAQVRNHSKVSLPSSKFKSKIADVLKSEGYNPLRHLEEAEARGVDLAEYF